MIKSRTVMKPYPIETTYISGRDMPCHVGYRPKIPPMFYFEILTQRKKKPCTGMEKKMVQTMYRESETQTELYVPEILEPVDPKLEILTLSWLSWNNGLPAGMHEVLMIERARQKRAWEHAVPTPCNEQTQEIRKMIIEAIEINEWKFREEEIATYNSLRMELAAKILKERMKECGRHYEKRVDDYARLKTAEKNYKLQKIRINFNRNLRKLIGIRTKANEKHNKLNIIEEHFDKTSDVYGPQMRFGNDPRHRHEKIYRDARYWKIFDNLEVINQDVKDLEDLQSPKPAFDYESKSKPKKYSKELCVRETKWTSDSLMQLHQDLRNLSSKRFEVLKECSLKQRIPPPVKIAETPVVQGIPDWEEDLYQASLFLQKMIKGRAIQAVMFEGRVRCQELLEELKSTCALQNFEDGIRAAERKRIYQLQRNNEIEAIQEKRKKEILLSLEGKTNADILDFLSKELLRLQNERLTHAYALLADRERNTREAAEAGRRQLEEQRRREHDEMFKQIVKLHQNTVENYLEDVIMENIKWTAERTARKHIHTVAKKVDRAAEEAHQRANELEEEEIIADLIHNFALPEVQKRIVRKRLNERQRNYLRTCHDEVYSNIEDLARGKRSPKGELLPLPRPAKHRIPHLIPVKVMRLKRMHESSSSVDLSAESIDMDFARKESKMIAPLETANEAAAEENAENAEEIWSSGFSRQEVILIDSKN